MFRTLKNWMSVLVLFVLIAAQVVPASALTISFTTAPPPLVIVSSTPTNNATGVGYTPSIEVHFNQNINGGWTNPLRYADNDAAVSGTGLYIYDNWLQSNLAGNTLLPGTRYYLEFHPSTPAGDTLNPTDPANQPYYDAASSQFRLYFTTASAGGWQSTDINGVSAGVNGGQTNVPITAAIKVKTTAALNGTTVTTANVVLHKSSAGGTIITAAAVLDPADATNQTVLVTPSANLEYSTTYYLVLSNVQDTLGNVLP